MSLLLEMFTYPFLVRAFLVGILVSLCAALLGVSLVLKRYSMIGDGLSHVSFGALAVAVALGWGALTLLVCYGLFLHLHVDYEDLMIWAPLSGVAIFTLALVRGALVRYRTN